jgi:hypothetical protein
MDSSREATSAIGRAQVLGPIPEPGRSRRSDQDERGALDRYPVICGPCHWCRFHCIDHERRVPDGLRRLVAMRQRCWWRRSRHATQPPSPSHCSCFSSHSRGSVLPDRAIVTPTPFTVIYMIMPVAYLAVVLSVPTLRSSLGWLHVGQFSPFLLTRWGAGRARNQENGGRNAVRGSIIAEG